MALPGQLEEIPVQNVMDAKAKSPQMKSTALQALADADLICDKFAVKGYGDLVDLVPGNSNVSKSLMIKAITCPSMHCCKQLRFFEVEPGCVRSGSAGDGTNLFFGPGVHAFFGLFYSFGDMYRVSDTEEIINGTRAIITVKQGLIGLAMDRGEPIILPPGMHQWDDPNLNFVKFIDLASSLITMGPYTLVTVEQSYAAITQDNGKQKVLGGGSSYMLTHQNWKFQAWLSMKMQTNKLSNLLMTTGDNIGLCITANVNWSIVDAVVAAGRNVDASLGSDTLKLMREDVNLQVTSSLASLVGAIHYGSQGTSGLQKAARDGAPAGPSSGEDGAAVAAVGEPEPEGKLDRKALWDPGRLQNAVNDANSICNRYGVQILSINLIAVAPADAQLREIMSRGAVATVSAEETTKAARAEANAALITAQAEAARAQAAADAKLIKARSDAEAVTIAVQGEATRAQAAADAMLIKARSEAEAAEISAKAEAEAERIRAQGAKDAGLLMGESEVAVSLAKLKIAYGPFTENQSSSFFFGLQGPGELPTALLGSHLANEVGATGLALAKGTRPGTVS
jgi:hypothetical protein